MTNKTSVFSPSFPSNQRHCSSVLNLAPVRSVAESLRIDYLRASDLEEFLKAHEKRIVAVVRYGDEPGLPEKMLFPTFIVELTQLNVEPVVEVWTSGSEVSQVNEGDSSFSFNDQFLFGYIPMAERSGVLLEEPTYFAYKRALCISSALGFPYLLRTWNYFPRINEDQNGLERYKRFCMGRHEAFFEHVKNYTSIVPAGTAIGTTAGELKIFFLSSRRSGKNIENPRQVNAYEYPSIYGPCSPSFSRATLYNFNKGAQLFIAGTSSIIGHSSRHYGNPGNQTRETVRNLLALIQRVKVQEKLLGRGKSERGLFKVYIRRVSHLKEIKDQLKEHLGGNHDFIFLAGDICRTELLFEIEGILTHRN